MKQDYAINADYNIGDLSTNHSFLLNGKPIGTNYTAGDGINISEDNVISVNQSIIPQGIPSRMRNELFWLYNTDRMA